MKQEFAPGLLSTQITKAAYYYPASRSRRMDLDIICAGWEDCRSDYLIKRSGFPWQAIELVVRGTGWVEAKGRRLRLRPGSLVSYGPGIAYRMTTDSADPMLKYFVDFTGTQSRKIISRERLVPGRVFQVPHPQELQIIVDQIIIEGNRKSELSREIANNYLRILLQKLHEARRENAGPGGSRTLESYLKAKTLLDKDYLHLSSAEAAAEGLGITPETLCRLFHRFSSTSPYQYLLQLKVNRAVDLLLSTHLLIKEVGERSGFQDAFQFSRIFKRLRGTSPELFRRTHVRT
jgi:AraC-like DNA-binding protein